MDRKKVSVSVMSISNVDVSFANVNVLKMSLTIPNTRLDFLLEA